MDASFGSLAFSAATVSAAIVSAAIVSVATVIQLDARTLIMDEPTSALSTAEVAILFEVIYELKAHGVSIIYISHKLDELLQIGGYVTVLRDGKLVAEKPAVEINVAWIIE
jgi:erythritol transport system ATP-binding protein